MYFQYAVTVVLNHGDIEKSPERIRTMEPFIDQYDRRERNFTTGSKDCKKFETNNKTVATNVLFLASKCDGLEKNTISKHNSEWKSSNII